jgi:ATP-dependent DNA helicase RecG
LHFYEKELPFELTEAQKRVVREIRHDLRTGFQMNRLLQGDVGSGKTMVAFLTMLLAKDNELQACLMAPTEILAQQHFAGLLPYAEAMDLHLECLTGSTKTADRNRILAGLADGTVDFVVGTHALIEDRVVFAQLGLAITLFVCGSRWRLAVFL